MAGWFRRNLFGFFTKENFIIKTQRIKKRAKYIGFIFFAGFIYLLDNIETVPYFERKRIMLLSEENEVEHFIDDNKDLELLPSDSKYVKNLNILGKYLLENISEEEREKKWTFNVINSPFVNAYSKLGKNVYFTSAIFDLLETNSQVAAILAHEISHCLIRHQAERLSTQLVFLPVINLM